MSIANRHFFILLCGVIHRAARYVCADYRRQTVQAHSVVPWEALNKSARAVGEGFCSKLRFENRRNTLCISRFSNRKVGTKDTLPAAADLFRASLVHSFAPRDSYVQYALHKQNSLSTSTIQIFRPSMQVCPFSSRRRAQVCGISRCRAGKPRRPRQAGGRTCSSSGC